MPTISKKLSQTDYEIIGDTQGVLIPVSPKRFRFIPENRISMAANTWYPYTVASIVENTGIDFDPAKGIVCKAGDVYAVQFPYAECTGAFGKTGYRIAQYDAGDTEQITVLLNTPGQNNACWGGTLTIHCVTDGYFQCAVSSDTAVMNIAYPDPRLCNVQITKLEQAAPYMVANKGALLSGGAFTFDSDGNAYTENYYLQEMQIGTWVDGKPLYRKVVQYGSGFTTPAANSTYTLTLPGQEAGLFMIRKKMVLVQAGGTHPIETKDPGIYIDGATTAINRRIDLAYTFATGALAIVFVQASSFPSAAYMGAFVILEYTKTTD
jgi:hypothetical protein